MARAASLLLLLAILSVVFGAVGTTAYDFRAFYCAGAAIREGADPYLTEPLHDCELNKTDHVFTAFARAVTLPAPLPGYDLAAFVPISRLPFAAAEAVWTFVLTVACTAAFLALSKLMGLPAIFTFSLLWLSLILLSLSYGELIPVSIAGLCISLWFAHEARWAGAGAGAILALAEPHIGLPVCLALALWQPRTRVVLAVAGAALILLSVSTLGLRENVEYFTHVLPLHALSELASDAQLSLSVILHYAGMTDRLASAIGTAAYLATAALSIALARIAAARFADGAYFVAVPGAFSVIGGSFIHVTDFVAATPLALLLYRDLPRARLLFVTALVLLALPWWQLALMVHQGLYMTIIMAALIAFYIAWKMGGQRITIAAVFAACAIALLVGVNHWYVQSSDAFHHRADPRVHVAIDLRYPEASWAWVNRKFISTGLPASWALRAPSWAGVFIVAIGVISATVSGRESLLIPGRRPEEVRTHA